MAQSDAELIRRTLDGDDNAFGFLVDKYKGAVHALAYRKIGDFHIAEDITQDTFLKAFQKLSTLKRHENFSGWLYVIAARCCISWLRENQHPMQSLEQVGAAQVEASAEREYSADRVRKQLQEALENLPESDRTVLTLHYLGGMTYEEVSRFIGASTGAVKNRLYRARHHLKEELIKMIHQTWGTLQLPPTFTQQLAEKIYRLNPAPAPVSKPQAPWITAVTLGVAALFVVAGKLFTSEFQQPYSLNPSTSVKLIELTEAPIVETPLPKPSFANHYDGDGNPVMAFAAGGDTKQVDKLRGSISGHVIYAGTGKPAADVPIRAAGIQPGIGDAHAHTGADGTYVLENVPVGPYVVMIGDTWEWHETFDWRAPANEGIHVEPDSISTGVDFSLTPGGFVEGKITDGDTGEPVAGVQIQVYDAAHPNSQGVGHRLNTDNQGRYRFRVTPGRVLVVANTTNNDAPYYIPFPGGEFYGEVAESETLSDIDFECLRGYSIHGTVVTADEQPIAGASVRANIIPIKGLVELPNHAATDAQGRFTLKGIPVNEETEQLVIIAEHDNLRGRASWSKEQVSAVEITLVPRPTATIVGQVIDVQGSPISHAGIGLSWEEGFAGTATTSPNSPVVVTSPEGNFTVGPTFSFGKSWLEVGGKYQIHATAAEYGRTSSEWFTLQEGEHTIPALVLHRAEHFIAGQVADWKGQPVSGATVFAEGSRTAVNGVSDHEGRFSLSNIADSRIKVYAFHQGPDCSDTDAEFDANREDVRVILAPNKPMISDVAGNSIRFDPFPYPLEGKQAPELKIYSRHSWLNSEPIALSSLRGKIAVLNFWSTYVNQESCDPWLPTLNRIHEKYSDKGVIVIGVHTSVHQLEGHPDIQEIEKSVIQWRIKYPIAIDSAGANANVDVNDWPSQFGATFNDYLVRSLPTILFVDRAGKVRTLFLIGGTLDEKVNALLNE
ncbi:MAG: sigma-70 family RNA polymerase sigma factor [Candidatus Poribacteria bacterium]|nr:sigma-70 family RNA polymerase sigma factor [Candidatus Poribacteria bacterium]